MKRLSLLMFITIISLATVGCSHNYYNIPRETLEKKVRVIGVAPIFLDADSDIRHPEKDTLSCLLLPLISLWNYQWHLRHMYWGRFHIAGTVPGLHRICSVFEYQPG